MKGIGQIGGREGGRAFTGRVLRSPRSACSSLYFIQAIIAVIECFHLFKHSSTEGVGEEEGKKRAKKTTWWWHKRQGRRKLNKKKRSEQTAVPHKEKNEGDIHPSEMRGHCHSINPSPEREKRRKRKRESTSFWREMKPKTNGKRKLINELSVVQQ